MYNKKEQQQREVSVWMQSCNMVMKSLTVHRLAVLPKKLLQIPSSSAAAEQNMQLLKLTTRIKNYRLLIKN